MTETRLCWPETSVPRVAPWAPWLRYIVPGTTQFLWLLANHPRLLSRMYVLEGVAEFGQFVLAANTHRDLEIVILRANWNVGHTYHFAVHAFWGLVRESVLGGPRAGRGFVAAIRQGRDAPYWNKRQAWLIRAADELHNELAISEETVRALRGHGYSDGELVEFAFVVGHYGLLGMLLESAAVPAEPLIPEPAPAERPRLPRPFAKNRGGIASPWRPGNDDTLLVHPVLRWALPRYARSIERVSSLDVHELVQAARGLDPGADPRRRVLFAAVAELYSEYVLSDTTWRQLRNHYTDAQLLELCTLVGHLRTHEMLTGTMVSLATPGRGTRRP
ncbi:hypothetical protein [Nocardia sp. NPDC052566]|uniref:hypothetical protein n=1 Tax=Nocardia sp. NPDC052566 TaxID=3364330 RepID=UPI0037C7515A